MKTIVRNLRRSLGREASRLGLQMRYDSLGKLLLCVIAGLGLHLLCLFAQRRADTTTHPGQRVAAPHLITHAGSAPS